MKPVPAQRQRFADPNTAVIAQPECPPYVLAEADFTSSAAHMTDFVRQHKPTRVVMAAECSMAANVEAELPEIDFVQPCNLSPHIKRTTLPKILDALVYMREELMIDPTITAKARQSVERMVN